MDGNDVSALYSLQQTAAPEARPK